MPPVMSEGRGSRSSATVYPRGRSVQTWTLEFCTGSCAMRSGCPCDGSGLRRGTRLPVSPRTAPRSSWTGSPFQLRPGSASAERSLTGLGTSGEEVVDEVPGPKFPRLQPDKKIITSVVGVCRTCLRAKVARRDSPHHLAGAFGAELDPAAHLDSAVGRDVLAQHDARPGISSQMHRLHGAAAGNHPEAAVAPFVP